LIKKQTTKKQNKTENPQNFLHGHLFQGNLSCLPVAVSNTILALGLEDVDFGIASI